MSISIKILSGLITCFALLTASCVEAETKQNAWIKGCEMSPGQCVAACQKDPLFCVQQINGYLIEAMNGRGTPSATTINMNVCKGRKSIPIVTCSFLSICDFATQHWRRSKSAIYCVKRTRMDKCPPSVA